MKKSAVLLLCIALTMFFCLFAACVAKPQTQEVTDLILPTMAEDQMSVIIKNGNNDYTNIVVTLGPAGVNAQTAEDVLQYLLDNQTISLDWTDSDFGKMLNSIGKIHPAPGTNQFVAVFTSVASDYGNWPGVATYKVGEVLLVFSQYGVSQMKVAPGAVIYFELETY